MAVCGGFKVMKQLYVLKRAPLAYIQILLCSFCLLSSCRIPKNKINKPSFVLLKASVSRRLPPCFSLTASLDYIGLNCTSHCRVEFCVEYDKQIHFVVKGPLGIEIVRGIINTKGVVALDRLHRVVYEWHYGQIKERYHFCCNYQLIQSFLFGIDYQDIYRDKKRLLVTSGEIRPSVAYTYDNSIMRKVQSAQLMNTKGDSRLTFLYRYKTTSCKRTAYLSGIKIHFSFINKDQLDQGMVELSGLKFKALKMPSIKCTIPSYYLRK